jgi:hypothetical protein
LNNLKGLDEFINTLTGYPYKDKSQVESAIRVCIETRHYPQALQLSKIFKSHTTQAEILIMMGDFDSIIEHFPFVPIENAYEILCSYGALLMKKNIIMRDYALGIAKDKKDGIEKLLNMFSLSDDKIWFLENLLEDWGIYLGGYERSGGKSHEDCSGLVHILFELYASRNFEKV